MASYPPAIERLLDELTRLPGVGPKTAERYLFALLRQPSAGLKAFGQAVANLHETILNCQRCHNFDTQSPCRYCRDRQRDQQVLCVVADAPDVLAIEQTGVYHGLYHVLGGTINTVEGQGPEQLHIADLLGRIPKEKITEVILAMNPDIEGETTSLYLKKALAPSGVRLTQLARGIPTGGDVTYLDEATLGEAITHRQPT
ncbi:MAG: recombination protein RecR [Candidatus Kerfeldbacteria bacterium]|nr:recombination protein RecR [Candidatus Kerfeldbacteria bacterium]